MTKISSDNSPLSPTSGLDRARAFMFASLISAYPDENFLRDLGPFLGDPEIDRIFQALAPENWQYLRVFLAEILPDAEALRDLRSLYIDVFEHAHPGSPIYESEYGRSRAMVKGVELLDVAAFYQAFGFTFGADGMRPDMVDHLAIELEFYALMLAKHEVLVEDADAEGMAVVVDGAAKFLRDHLGRFIGAILKRPSVATSPFYFHGLSCVHSLVAAECRLMAVEPTQADWLEGFESESMQCGSLGCLSGNPEVLGKANVDV